MLLGKSIIMINNRILFRVGTVSFPRRKIIMYVIDESEQNDYLIK